MSEREIMSETVNESTPLLSNDETSNRSIIKNPWYKTPSSYWALFLCTVNAFSFGLILTSRVEFYVQVVCKYYYNSKDFNDVNNIDKCNIPEIHAITSQLMMVLTLCIALPGIFVLVPFGALSDRKGRRLVILIAFIGRVLDFSSIILVGNYIESFGIGFLIVGQLMDGLLGGYPAMTAAMYAYAADCTTSERRRVIFGMMHGGLLLGIGIGPIIGGMITEFTNDLLSVFYVSIVIFILVILFVLFIMPESLSKERQLYNQKHQHNDNNNIFKKFLNIFTPLSIFFSNNLHNNERFQNDENREKVPVINAGKYSLLATAGISLMIATSYAGIQTIIFLYIRYKFEWSLVDQGYLFGAMCLTRVVVLMFLFPLFVKTFKERQERIDNRNVQPQREDNDNIVIENNKLVQDEKRMNRELVFDLWVIRTGLVIDVIGYVMYGMATNGTTFFAGACFSSAGIISIPTLKSLQTNLVLPSQTGVLLGALSVLESVTNVIGPIVYNTLYSILVIEEMPHLIWYGISASFIIGCLISFSIRAVKSKNRNVEMGDVTSS